MREDDTGAAVSLHTQTLSWLDGLSLRAQGTITLPPGLAAGGAFGSIILSIAGFSGGYVSLGTLGLLLFGLALGLAGRMRARMVLAAMLWVAHAALALACVVVGADGLAAITPVVYVVLSGAAGQGLGLVLSVALGRASAT